MIIYARRVIMRPLKDWKGRDRLVAEYTDLVAAIMDGAPRYGLYDPVVWGGHWREIFDEAECLRQLGLWEDWHRADAQGNLSQITADGYAWLQAVLGQDLSATQEHGIYTREVPQPLFGLQPGMRSKA